LQLPSPGTLHTPWSTVIEAPATNYSTARFTLLLSWALAEVDALLAVGEVRLEISPTIDSRDTLEHLSRACFKALLGSGAFGIQAGSEVLAVLNKLCALCIG